MMHEPTTSEPSRNTAVAALRCCERGLIYPDGGRRCWTHASAEDRQLLDDLDEWGIARGIPPSRGDLDERLAWPYGPNIDAGVRLDMLSWAEAHDLHYVPRSHRCLDWLRDGWCDGDCPTWAEQARSAWDDVPPPTWQGRPSWFDHVTLWFNARERVLVAQPYHLDDKDERQLDALASEPGLRVERAPSGWYNYRAKWVALWAPLDVETVAA